MYKPSSEESNSNTDLIASQATAVLFAKVVRHGMPYFLPFISCREVPTLYLPLDERMHYRKLQINVRLPTKKPACNMAANLSPYKSTFLTEVKSMAS